MPYPDGPSSSDRGQRAIGLGTAVAEELPEIAHLAHHVPIHLGGDQLVLVRARLGDDLAARIDEIGGAIETADAPGLLGADTVDGADIAAIRRGGGGLFELPEILTQPRDRRRGIDDVLGAVERQRSPTLGE